MIAPMVKLSAELFLNQLGESQKLKSVVPLSGGLINYTYKAISESGISLLLQRFNTEVFKNPMAIQGNYQKINDFTLKHKLSIKLPQPIPSSDGSLLFKDPEGGYWRAFVFIEDSVSFLTAVQSEQAYTTAKAFAEFSASLSEFPAAELEITIPDFHNLSFRFWQFQEALTHSGEERKSIASPWIKKLLDRSHYKDFYDTMLASPSDFKLRVMHHDAKIANMLFDVHTHEVVCLVDFDTTMPGYYFSDLGDMIRTMTCSHDENHTNFEELSIREDFYKALINGYFEKMSSELTVQEKQNIHQSGLLMFYMQALRFLADYLNNDIYYRIQYSDQNLHRAINQITLLTQLEKMLEIKP